MQTLALVWGLLAAAGMIVGFVPCLGAWNWINIPFAGLGLVFSVVAVALSRERPRTHGALAILLCAIAVLLGVIRLVIGGGFV